MEPSKEEVLEVVGNARVHKTYTLEQLAQIRQQHNMIAARATAPIYDGVEAEYANPETRQQIINEYKKIRQDSIKEYEKLRQTYVDLFDKLDNPGGRLSYFNYPKDRGLPWNNMEKIPHARNSRDVYGILYRQFNEQFGPGTSPLTEGELSTMSVSEIEKTISKMNEVVSQFINFLEKKSQYGRLKRAMTTGKTSDNPPLNIVSATKQRQGGGRRRKTHRKTRHQRRRHTRVSEVAKR